MIYCIYTVENIIYVQCYAYNNRNNIVYLFETILDLKFLSIELRKLKYLILYYIRKWVYSILEFPYIVY